MSDSIEIEPTSSCFVQIDAVALQSHSKTLPITQYALLKNGVNAKCGTYAGWGL
jgi:hypothetical protein